jgi:hypothetical protein
LEIEELLDLYNNLTKKDVEAIVKSPDILEKFSEIHDELDGIKKMPKEHRMKIKSMI